MSDPMKLRISRYINISEARSSTIAEYDRARAAYFLSDSASQAGSAVKEELISTCVVSYLSHNPSTLPVRADAAPKAAIGVGSPSITYNLIVDTDTIRTWVGASRDYVSTSTSKNSGASVTFSRGLLSLSGEDTEFGPRLFLSQSIDEGTEWTDQVTLAPELVITGQSIGVASSSSGFGDIDGVLGLGRTARNEETVPTMMASLFSQGAISTEALGLSLMPRSADSYGGEISFGDADTTAITGDVTYVPITSTAPASSYWGFDAAATYGGKELLNSVGIVDIGTTLILLASDSFQEYQRVTGGVLDTETGLLKLTSTEFEALETLEFNIGGTTFSLMPGAQIWPRALNASVGGSEDAIYLVVADLGSPSGQGLDFILGQAFMERFYTVLYSTNEQVLQATTLQILQFEDTLAGAPAAKRAQHTTAGADTPSPGRDTASPSKADDKKPKMQDNRSLIDKRGTRPRDFFKEKPQSLKGNIGSHSGIPQRTVGTFGGRGGQGKSVKQGSGDVEIASAEANCSKTAVKCSIRLEGSRLEGTAAMMTIARFNLLPHGSAHLIPMCLRSGGALASVLAHVWSTTLSSISYTPIYMYIERYLCLGPELLENDLSRLTSYR
ncbi:unnamed protein product [Mycena citricolor]|uniref:Peptidase A1 domain-containing protein n=1 Tax=Mycena citricolor TaxID=2018698 RepID=A0AAD2GXN3_9AGAR|nr:unnamed protein product [Mycena citricolor]